MVATNQDFKDAMALSGNKPAVTNTQLARVQAMIDATQSLVDGNDDPRSATADDLFDQWYEDLVKRVLAYEKSLTLVTF